MKRFIIASLSILLIAAAPTFKAEAAAVNATTFSNAGNATRAFNPTTLNRSATSATHKQLKPFNLVSLAYQGYLRNQGIPGYSGLISAYNARKITAKDIVQSAVEAKRLSSDVLGDRSYLRAVEARLNSLSID